MDLQLSLNEQLMEQIFRHGFFHADPHPGNLFILPGNVVCFIDFGQMGRLSRRDQEDFTALVLSLLRKDESEMVSGVLRTTVQQGEVNRERLERDLVFLVDRYLYQPLDKLEAAKIFQDLLTLVVQLIFAFLHVAQTFFQIRFLLGKSIP